MFGYIIRRMRHNQEEQRSSHPENKDILFTEHCGISHKSDLFLAE